MVVRFKASIYRLVAAIALAVFLPVLSQTAFAQIPVDVDFGIRGGVFNSGGIPLEVPNNHYFPDVYTTDQPQFPVTVGPTIGVLFNGHWYVRLEAARSRFSFHYAQGTNSHFPYDSTPQVTSVTEGHSWQYPSSFRMLQATDWCSHLAAADSVSVPVSAEQLQQQQRALSGRPQLRAPRDHSTRPRPPQPLDSTRIPY